MMQYSAVTSAVFSLRAMHGFVVHIIAILLFFYRTVLLDNVKIPFYQQMHLLLNIKNVKIYIKISYIRSYMFRSTWTILRELTLSLAKVTLLYN